MQYRYPLHIHFKFFALAPQLTVLDAQGAPLLYVEQKLLALKERVRVFLNEQKTTELFTIQADRIFDFDAEYTITDSASQRVLGSLQREGMASLFKASYKIKGADGVVCYTIKESNPWIKVLDGLAEMVPFLGFFTGYFFHPKYAVLSQPGQEVFSLVKKPSFTEAVYEIIPHLSDLPSEDEQLIILALMMLVQLERHRG